VYFQISPQEQGRCDFSGTAEAYQCGSAVVPNALLPLNASTGRILVVGPTANSLGSLSSGWSIHWQGVNDDSQFSHGTTILEGVRTVYDASQVEYHEGCHFEGDSHARQTCTPVDLEATRTSASNADVIVVCLGEEPYTEKPGDIDDLQIHQGQVQLITELNKAGKPMVLVLVEGRPRQLEGIQRLSNVHAVVHALVPGPEGGMAVAEILFGLVNPSGRMPITYPASTGSTHYPHWHAVSSQCVGAQVFLSATTMSCPVDFVFGQGLSYTTFAYTGFKWYTGAGAPASQAKAMEIGSAFTVELTVENTGTMDANHTVLLYFIQAYRRVTPEANRLLGFDKVFVAAGASKKVSFQLSTTDFSYIGVDYDRVVETGKYTLALGDSQYGVPGSDEECVTKGLCVDVHLEAPNCPRANEPLSAASGALCNVPVKYSLPPLAPPPSAAPTETPPASTSEEYGPSSGAIVVAFGLLCICLVGMAVGVRYLAVPVPPENAPPSNLPGVAHVALEEQYEKGGP